MAYLQGFRALPLDNARTEAVLAGLKAAENVEVVASPEGGYTQATGLAAAQDVLQANPDVDVIIGSSQAILGAEQAVEDAGLTGRVALIGNGAPRQAVAAVREGRWFAIWADAESARARRRLRWRSARSVAKRCHRRSTPRSCSRLRSAPRKICRTTSRVSGTRKLPHPCLAPCV